MPASPSSSEDSKTAVNALLAYYNNLYFFQKWFFPASVETALNNYNGSKDAVTISFVCSASSELDGFSRWFSHFFFPALQVFSETPLMKLWNTASGAGLFNGGSSRDNQDKIIAHNAPNELAQAISRWMNNNGKVSWINQDDFDLLADYHDPEAVKNRHAPIPLDTNRNDNLNLAAQPLEKAKNALSVQIKNNKDCLSSLEQSQDPEALVAAINLLDANDILLYADGRVSGCFSDISKHANPLLAADCLLLAIKAMQKANLLNGENLDNFRANCKAILRKDDKLEEIWLDLVNKQSLTAEMFDKLIDQIPKKTDADAKKYFAEVVRGEISLTVSDNRNSFLKSNAPVDSGDEHKIQQANKFNM